MDNSGMIPSSSYDSRTVSTTAYSQTVMAPHYAPGISYSVPPTTVITQQSPRQQNPFSSTAFGQGSSVPLLGMNYIQPRPDLQMLALRSGPPSVIQTGYMVENRSPAIKSEIGGSSRITTNWNLNSNVSVFKTAPSNTPPPTKGPDQVIFSTNVDTLMKAIQTKAQLPDQEKSLPVEQSQTVAGYSPKPFYQNASPTFTDNIDKKQRLTTIDSQGDESTVKKYPCPIPGCNKSFHQKTHIQIHIRAHTGQKPYACKQPNCRQRFSQLGNLKTHERRHTGERPYSCDLCGKTFAQKGNVRAHKITHEHSKPFLCKLEDDNGNICGKHFTQLGNLKSHQNKFHVEALRKLTKLFTSIQDGDPISSADKELFEYFAKLYRNSNKGIKGRGKDRRVTTVPASGSSMGFMSRGMTNHFSDIMNVNGLENHGLGGISMGLSMNREGSHHSNATSGYDMDYEDGSGSQGSASTSGSIYGGPVETYESESRELAFGDRIYSSQEDARKRHENMDVGKALTLTGMYQ